MKFLAFALVFSALFGISSAANAEPACSAQTDQWVVAHPMPAHQVRDMLGDARLSVDGSASAQLPVFFVTHEISGMKCGTRSFMLPAFVAPYREFFVGVPNVRAEVPRADAGQTFFYMARLELDSRIAVWVGREFYGFNKFYNSDTSWDLDCSRVESRFGGDVDVSLSARSVGKVAETGAVLARIAPLLGQPSIGLEGTRTAITSSITVEPKGAEGIEGRLQLGSFRVGKHSFGEAIGFGPLTLRNGVPVGGYRLKAKFILGLPEEL